MALSMKEYLKRYESEAEKPKKKKKKRKNDNALKGKGTLTIVDTDLAWQKEIKEASPESEAEQGDAPLVIEDVEFKRMQRLEALRMRPYIATASDGSGWVSINETLNQGSSKRSIGFATSPSGKEHAQGMSPVRSGAKDDGGESTIQSRERDIRKSRHDTPDEDLWDDAKHYDEDLSHQRRERISEKRRHDTPDRGLSPPRHLAPASEGHYDSPQSSSPRTGKDLDLSPPRRRQTSSVTGHDGSSESNQRRTGKLTDLSPPRRRQPSLGSGCHYSPHSSPPRTGKSVDLSPPRRRQNFLKSVGHNIPNSSPSRTEENADLSPPRRKQTSVRSGRHDSPDSSPSRTGKSVDLSPLRRRQTFLKSGDHNSPDTGPSRTAKNLDLSPPRRRLTSTRAGRHDSFESSPPRTEKSLILSPPRKSQMSLRMVERDEDDMDISLKRKFNHNESDSRDPEKLKRKEIMADGTAAGLQSGRQLSKETEKKKKDDSARLKVDVSVSGRHANTVYRDKHGKRLEGVDEILKLQQAEEPNKQEKPLEWGRGLVQKREAEARYAELEAEKKKPFARSRDDPDLDKELKEQIRWGDPMAHLVKKKVGEPVLVDLGANELMKESGFIVPQSIPKHSWLKRGVTAPPNRYDIKPGRHWDGVDRSTGYERGMFQRQNEKEAERVEAYLWSVADM